MRRGVRMRTGAVLALVTLAGCGLAPPPAAPPAAMRAGVTQHVILVSIDGLRPDAIDAAPAPTLQRLAREGAFSWQARTVVPSKTLPSHASMLTGVPVEEHGITWNTNRTAAYGSVRVTTALEVAHAAGLHTAAFVGKRKLLHLLREGSLDRERYPRTDVVLTADRVAEEAAEYLRFARPNLVFVHLADPDLAGHSFGWMSRPYRWAVRRADRAVAHLHAAAQRAYGDDFVLLVTSDHGGEGRGHGRPSEPDVRIPWIVWGQGVRSGPIAAEIRTYDTAATALWLLGLAPPDGWAGRPVHAAFTRDAQLPSDAPGAGR